MCYKYFTLQSHLKVKKPSLKCVEIFSSENLLKSFHRSLRRDNATVFRCLKKSGKTNIHGSKEVLFIYVVSEDSFLSKLRFTSSAKHRLLEWLCLEGK